MRSVRARVDALADALAVLLRREQRELLELRGALEATRADEEPRGNEELLLVATTSY